MSAVRSIARLQNEDRTQAIARARAMSWWSLVLHVIPTNSCGRWVWRIKA